MQDDELLQAFVVGDLAEHDPALRDRCAADPDFAARLAALRQARQQVAEGLAEARAVLASSPPAPARLNVLDMIAAADVQQVQRRRYRWLGAALAAAAVLLLALLWPRGESPGTVDPRLGSSADDGMSWTPEAGFQWPGTELATYRVVVEFPGEPGAPRKSGRLTEPRWQPEFELPPGCRWGVEVRHPDNRLQFLGWRRESR